VIGATVAVGPARVSIAATRDRVGAIATVARVAAAFLMLGARSTGDGAIGAVAAVLAGVGDVDRDVRNDHVDAGVAPRIENVDLARTRKAQCKDARGY
jgi:hypothetical protein